jgi:hypothetical protein
VILASHAEGIEAERLLLLARDRDHDRGCAARIMLRT